MASGPPETPDALREALISIFPAFAEEWETNERPETFHQVLLTFTPCFLAHSCSIGQLQALAALINQGVATGGAQGNAWSTCLLEHLRQIDAWKALQPHLSELARQRSRP